MEQRGMKTRAIFINTEQSFEFPVDTMTWNYLDGEHLEFVHDGYAKPRALVRHGDVSFFTSRLKVPGLPLTFRSTNLVFLPEFGTQVTVSTFAFGTSRTTIKISSDGDRGSRVQTEYAWFLPRIFTPLAPVLKRLVIRWNKSVNAEDFPLRSRRTFVMQRGFADFHGMRAPNPAAERSLTLPIVVPEDSPILKGPFHLKTKRRVKLHFKEEEIVVLQA